MQPTVGFMTHVICWLTAKDRDQLRNPTLGNQGGPGKSGTYNLRKRLQQHLFFNDADPSEI